MKLSKSEAHPSVAMEVRAKYRVWRLWLGCSRRENINSEIWSHCDEI